MGTLPIACEEGEESKGSSLPLNLVPGPNEVPAIKVEAEGEALQDLARTALPSMSRAPKVGKRGLATTMEAQAMASEA